MFGREENRYFMLNGRLSRSLTGRFLAVIPISVSGKTTPLSSLSAYVLREAMAAGSLGEAEVMMANGPAFNQL